MIFTRMLGAFRFHQLFLKYWAGTHCGVLSLLSFLCRWNLGELKKQLPYREGSWVQAWGVSALKEGKCLRLFVCLFVFHHIAEIKQSGPNKSKMCWSLSVLFEYVIYDICTVSWLGCLPFHERLISASCWGKANQCSN